MKTPIHLRRSYVHRWSDGFKIVSHLPKNTGGVLGMLISLNSWNPFGKWLTLTKHYNFTRRSKKTHVMHTWNLDYVEIFTYNSNKFLFSQNGRIFVFYDFIRSMSVRALFPNFSPSRILMCQIHNLIKVYFFSLSPITIKLYSLSAKETSIIIHHPI